MKYLIVSLALFLSGCLATAPKFPNIPPDLSASCPELKEVEKGTTELSKMLDVVVQNYGTYYECRVKIDAWLEWHKTQKKIYDDAAK
jgi:hypothetical protein